MSRAIRRPFLWRHLLCGAALALLSTLPTDSAAQTESLAGRVLKAGSPVRGAQVTLHRVTPRASGVVARQQTSPDGRFLFRLPPPDTGGFTVFFATVDHLSVRYFGAPIHPGEVAADYLVEVFDTTSSLPGAVSVARRDLILLPETEGGWVVNEVVRIVNRGRKALVPRGGMPAAHFFIPDGAVDFEAGEGEAAATDVRLMGDRVLLTASLVPGPRELLIRYRLPATLRGAEIAIADATDTFNVFVRQPSPEIRVDGLSSTRVVNFENERFVQYGGIAVRPGSEVRVTWARTGLPVSPVAAGVVAALLVLAAGSWAAFRNRDAAMRASGAGAERSAPRPAAG